MTTPPELLEHSLDVHGDTLYRLALLLAGDERGAAGLLRDLAAALGPALAAPDGEPAPLDEPALLARLVAVARAAEARAAARRQPALAAPRRARANLFAPFALQRLTLDQRAALGLHLLLGYDGVRSARVLGGDPAGARATLIAGARALGHAAGASLTDRFSDDACAGVRAILADPAAGSRHSAAVRGHLAGCAPCRSFDHAWSSILQAVEEALRRALRERTLPAALRAKLLAAAAPARARRAPSWRVTRLALAPLGVLALIVAMILPGFTREAVTVVERSPGGPVDAQALIAKSLARHTAAPARGGVWHGRYETVWFFNDSVYAPLRAEVWLDSSNPSRHRLQLTHRDGGAPYELQIGDGTRRLAYALDAAYAPSLYGALATSARIDEPALINQPLDPRGQLRARDERLHTGPWSLPPAYLAQAQAATDLRLLGRQRDGGRVVQIISFSGVSPLGLPPDAPGATAERVTVLLALDSEDGLLRSATELSGPAGAAQTGRVTWRLVDEEWLGGFEQVAEAFDVERAWTGIGDFGERGRTASADVAMPLIDARALGDPAGLLAVGRLPFWTPSEAPAGVDRALLVWENRDQEVGIFPRGLVYLGPGRRLVLAFNSQRVLDGERLAVGPWRVTLAPGRGQRYTAFLARPEGSPNLTEYGLLDESAKILIDAVGFTRAELEAVIAGMAPFDLAALAAQAQLFAVPGAGDPAARQALIGAAAAAARPADGAVARTTLRAYSRHAPAVEDPRRDPYHQPPYQGLPEATVVEEWLAPAGAPPALYLRTSDPAGGIGLAERYVGAERAWHYQPRTDTLQLFGPLVASYSTRLPRLAGLALDLLNRPGALALEEAPGGGSLVRLSEAARESPRYSQGALSPTPVAPYLFDLQPLTITTELALSPLGEAEAVRVYAERGAGRTLIESYEVTARASVPPAEAPAALGDGAPPQAALVRDFSSGGAAPMPNPVRVDSLAEAQGWEGLALYGLPDELATLLAVEQGDRAYQGVNPASSLDEALVRGLALRLTYRAPAGEYTPESFDVVLNQGPRASLAALLRSSSASPWGTSEPIRLEVAGAEVDAWYGQGLRSYLIVELGETLLILDSARPIGDAALRALLAGLRPIER